MSLAGTQAATENEVQATPAIVSPGKALWNQREVIASLGERFKALQAAVGHPGDLNLYQYAQIAAFALAFQPNVIIELGRLFGNSTCCFLEVANQLGGSKACKLVSLCLNDAWFKHTAPRVKKIVPEEWFATGEILQCNILDYDFLPILKSARRCLVFWDAHGFEVAECVLGNLLPGLAEKPHVVIMHDLSDTRYDRCGRDYAGLGLWKGESAAPPAFWLGHIFSRVAQAISAVDFTTRNNIPLHSAAESINAEIGSDPAKLAALREMLPDEFVSLQAHWFWFSLNEARGKVVFPAFRRGTGHASTVELPTQAEPLRKKLDSLKELLEARGEQDFPARRASSREDIESLTAGFAEHERLLTNLAERNRELELRLQVETNSAGGRLLGKCRTLRERVAPGGTRRRRFYDLVAKGFRSGDTNSDKQRV